MKTSNLSESISRWALGPNVGESSKCIALVMLGIPNNGWHPHDPSDLNRCLLLLGQVPAIRPRLPEMAKVSPEWSGLIARWDEIEASVFG